MYSFIIDNDFQMLTLRLPDAEYEKLEEDIFNKGCQKPLDVWQEVLLDGHKRYDICQKWNIPFTVRRHYFKNRHEAIAWICKNNINRSSLRDEINKFLIGKHYEAAKAIYLIGCNPTEPVPKYLYRIAGNLGKLYKIAAGTVYKYGVYTRGIIQIFSMNSEFAHQILAGKLKVSHDNVEKLSKYPPTRLQQLYDFVIENKIDYICYSEMRQEYLWINPPAQPKPALLKPPVQNTINKPQNLNIKQIPEYDPDAEISSLTLTIPSWISSIKRTQSIADLTKVSVKAKNDLNSQLHRLADTINTMLLSTEEKN